MLSEAGQVSGVKSDIIGHIFAEKWLDQSPNLEIGTLSKQSKSISNIKECSRFVSKVMKCTSEAHKSSRSCYQSFKKIDKFYQNLLGSYLVNETYRILLIGGGQKGKETNIYELSSPGPKP